MVEPVRHAGSFLEWAVASRPASGEIACGDVAQVTMGPTRGVLAVVDGLGHGPDAARAATLAAKIVEHHQTDGPGALLTAIHEGLAESRGAAATVAVVDADEGRLDWLGVGNVDGVVVHPGGPLTRTHGVFLAGGVLGDRLPALHRSEPVWLQAGDRIVLATDGVRGDLAVAARADLRVDVLARRILAQHAVPEDDALVLVAHYRPPQPRGMAL